MRIKTMFTSQGVELSGLLETPESGIRCYALFAHCFTCGKDIAAASRISRALTRHGIAVLRFDFTGLGNSDGDFSNTNFSSNIQDLLAAVNFLRIRYQAPQLLVGHSLGGAAVLAMAGKVPEASAVVTIGSPYRADHVLKNFSASLEQIESEGVAEVSLGSRRFRIRKQFLDDLEHHSAQDMARLKKALLILHAPGDSVVPIEEAEKIYREAKHPKSFISLDDADHLLSRRQDSEYVAATIAAWASRYLPPPETGGSNGKVKAGHVVVEEKNHSFTQHVSSDSHYWLADEPLAVGGDNAGPDPYEHLLAALGACTAMTLRMYARRKSLPLEHVRVELSHQRVHARDCEACDVQVGMVDRIDRHITLRGGLDEAQQGRLMEIADRCPVHRTLHGPVAIVTRLEREAIDT